MGAIDQYPIVLACQVIGILAAASSSQHLAMLHWQLLAAQCPSLMPTVVLKIPMDELLQLLWNLHAPADL
jgi:hypothetical protein